jgi:DNA polymerase III sliding clamp (beta) subunit (PCNA family)
VFETATLVDAIKKAERVAPSKGSAFDKAAGIIMEITTGDDPSIVIRSTDLNIFWTEWIDCVSAEGETVIWRFPSKLLAGVCSTLPIGSGKQVKLEDERNGRSHSVRLSQARTRAKFNLIDPEYYPSWLVFDPDGLIPVPELGGRIGQVEWAAANGNEPPYSGVHFDGEIVVATNRYLLCSAPLVIPELTHPVTVPSGILSGVLPKKGDVSIGFDGNQLLIMPDEHSQIRTVTYATPYPNVKRVMETVPPNRVDIDRNSLVEIINRATNFTGADRFQALHVWIGEEEIAVMMSNTEMGLLGDVVEIPGQAVHTRTEYKFTPKNLLDGLINCPNEKITILYDPAKPAFRWQVTDSAGYNAWIIPRKNDTDTQGA